ncbi:hypothetical protein, partial [Xenorhabdus bovienii]|uniref:hypothetical protein n=1 Tax=Xenorhabdus bovienii TaxID=40576 RepID=UPI0023B2AF2C
GRIINEQDKCFAHMALVEHETTKSCKTKKPHQKSFGVRHRMNYVWVDGRKSFILNGYQAL